MLLKRLSLVKTLNFRVILFAFALIFGVVFSIPSLTQSEQGKKITLGLDLQGGLHMLLGIKSEIAIESRIKSMAASVKYIFDDEEIIFDELRVVDGDTPEEKKITFELLDGDDVTKATELLKKELEGIALS